MGGLFRAHGNWTEAVAGNWSQLDLASLEGRLRGLLITFIRIRLIIMIIMIIMMIMIMIMIIVIMIFIFIFIIIIAIMIIITILIITITRRRIALPGRHVDLRVEVPLHPAARRHHHQPRAPHGRR